MITLVPDEVIIAQIEAKGTGIHGSWKVKGKGVLYITGYRIAFEDEKKGVILNLDYHGELSSLKAVGNENLLISWHKDGYAGKMEFDVGDATSLEAKIGESVDKARTMEAETTTTESTNSATKDTSSIAMEMIDLLHDYSIEGYNKYNKLEANLNYLKPYIKTKLGNLIYASWNYPDPMELVWLIARDNAETTFHTVIKFHPNALNNASSEFLNKIATEAIRLKFTIDRSKIRKDYNYDPLRIKVTEIDGYLVGLAVTHNDSYFVLHEEDYRRDLRDSTGPSYYEEGNEVFNELVNAWKQWRIAARRYDLNGAMKAKDKIYEVENKWHKKEFGNDADNEYYSWLTEGPQRAYLELHTAYLEAMVKKGRLPKDTVSPLIQADEMIVTDFANWDELRRKGLAEPAV